MSYLLSYIFIYILVFVSGSPGKSTGLSYKPTEFEQSSSIQISWKHPTDLNGHDPDKLSYEVTNCRVGSNCEASNIIARLVKSATVIGKTSYTVVGLLPSTTYQVTIKAVGLNMVGPGASLNVTTGSQGILSLLYLLQSKQMFHYEQHTSITYIL